MSDPLETIDAGAVQVTIRRYRESAPELEPAPAPPDPPAPAAIVAFQFKPWWAP